MLYQLSYASATQTKGDYQKGTAIARARRAASNSDALTNCLGDLIVQHDMGKATRDFERHSFLQKKNDSPPEFETTGFAV
jgi:hypothetical protein